MNTSLVLLLLYSVALMALGLWIGRRVRGARDFFVAGRALGPGLLFSTLLAANIGAGSTVGATALGYHDGLSAWWWVGSAAIGSVVLAMWVGPAIWRLAVRHDLRTVGDYLELRYSASVRGLVAVSLWLASLAVLASQLIAMSTILSVVADAPKWLGCTIGGAIVTAYSSAGGLKAGAWVNVVQLTVKMTGFAIALPLALSAVGGWSAVASLTPPAPDYWSFWSGGSSGVIYLALLAPGFFVSPGILQKVFGARDERAVRLGVGLNALGLFLYAIVPVVLGMVARVRFGDLERPDLALPMILAQGLPLAIGTLGLAAVFSAELSAADAALLMLTTTLSQDLYKRFVDPSADEGRVLQIARVTTVVAGAIATAIAIVSPSVVQTLTIFYALLSVSLFMPIVGGLYVRSAGSAHALAAIVFGVVTMLVAHVSTDGRGIGIWTPALLGNLAAIAGFAVMIALQAWGPPLGGPGPAKAGPHD